MEESSGNHNTAISVYQQRQWLAGFHGLPSQGLGPLLVLPVNDPAQTEAMSFFEFISVKHLNEYHPSESWRQTLMFFSQTVPSVRYAAVALGLMHRNYMDRKTGDWLPDEAPLLYYNRAIQHLLNQENYDSIETTAITLLVCYLFTCFDQLAGNYATAFKHLHGGLELLRNMDEAILNNNNNMFDDFKTSPARSLLYQVIKRIRRLDVQAVMFVTDWTPVELHDTLMPPLPSSDSTFESFDQASDDLYTLMARVMSLRNTEQEMIMEGKAPPAPSPLKAVILVQLETWSSLFENMVQQGSHHSKSYPLISLLRLQYFVAWTFLSAYGPGREMEYDNFLPHFQQCVALAAEIAAANQATLTPEIGIVPMLYIIGVKCRNPVVRREALRILQRQPIREAVWDSMFAAKVIERVIEIEEAGMVQGMEPIPMWQRVEALTWHHVVSGPSAPRLDIMYTFCALEGLHTESLMI